MYNSFVKGNKSDIAKRGEYGDGAGGIPMIKQKISNKWLHLSLVLISNLVFRASFLRTLFLNSFLIFHVQLQKQKVCCGPIWRLGRRDERVLQGFVKKLHMNGGV